MADAVFTDPEAFRVAYAKAPKELYVALESRLRAYGEAFSMGTIVKKRLSGRPGLITHSGAAGIKGSFKSDVRGSNLDNLGLVIWTDYPHAATHEFGATIRARLAKYLHFFYEMIQQWVMVKEVTIPARLEFFKTWEEDAPLRDRMYQAAIAEALVAMAGQATAPDANRGGQPKTGEG